MMMKKICLLSLLLLAGMTIAIISFREPEPILPVPTEATELPVLSPERLRAEDQGREALRYYILGRVSVEKIAREEKKGTAPAKVLLQESTECWQEACQKAKLMKDTPLPAEKNVSLSLPVLGVASASMPLDRKRGEKLTEERKRIIAFYADYPYRDNLQILACQMEHDTALALKLLSQAREGNLSFQQAASTLAENCKIHLTSHSLGGSLKFPRDESHEAFACFWGGTETFVRIAPEDTALLLGKQADIVFITGDTEITLGEKPLSVLDLDVLGQKYAETAETTGLQ